jgi:hypothetical protein
LHHTTAFGVQLHGSSISWSADVLSGLGDTPLAGLKTPKSYRFHGRVRKPRGPPIGYHAVVQKSRPTQNKRARERARQEKQQMKTARRLEAKSRKTSSPDGSNAGEDPDIAGIVPGPQRSPWADMGDFSMAPDEAEDEDVEKTED